MSPIPLSARVLRSACLLPLFFLPRATAQEEPPLEVLAPKKFEITAAVVHVLGRTAPKNTVSVGGVPAEVYATGAFAADNLPVEPGENTIRIVATSPSGEQTAHELHIKRVEAPDPRPITTLTVTHPAEDVALLPGDVLTVRAVGPPGRSGQATLFDGALTVPLAEESNDEDSTGRYTATVRVPEDNTAEASEIVVRLTGDQPLEQSAPGKLSVWSPSAPRVAEVRGQRVGVTFGLHYVRLGGPYAAEIPRGTRVEVIGRSGRNLKVRLSGSLTGWVRARDRSGAEQVALLPKGTPLPHNSFTYFLVTGDEEHDQLSFDLSAPVAHSIRSRTTPHNELVIDFYNSHHATTWISRKRSALFLGDPTAEQVATGHVRVTVPVDSKQIWGYWSEMDGNTLRVFVRRPPKSYTPPASPLLGRLIALEAGHGGGDSGAVGHMGVREEDVNLMAVTAIDSELRDRGAKTILLRPGDTSPSLRERAEQANRAGAIFLLSLHANAAGSDRGFLRVSGTSVYYLQDHCRRPAELLWQKMLGLEWDDFGLVGNFHYSPLRNTRTLAVLIEQAFMSHPGDEARLADPAYHRKQAEVVTDGLEQFFAEACSQ